MRLVDFNKYIVQDNSRYEWRTIDDSVVCPRCGLESRWTFDIDKQQNVCACGMIWARGRYKTFILSNQDRKEDTANFDDIDSVVGLDMHSGEAAE